MITRRTMLGATALAGAALVTGTASAIGTGRRSIAEELARFVTDLAEQGQFSGTVMLDYRGRTVFSAAHGLADQKTATPNTLATRFTTASVGKFFTGVTAAHLVQSGRLSYSTTFGQAVPQLRNPQLRDLTLHQLLTHTAALPQAQPNLPVRRAMEYLPTLEVLQLVGQPGTRFQYSNAGYLAAAIMVEQAGRCDFESAVRTHVFAPARMTNTFALHGDRPGVPIATRHLPGGETVPPDTASGAGGYYTTVRDLVSFGHALLRHRLLDRQHTTELVTGKVSTGPDNNSYAYGCSVITVNGHPIVWHNGGGPGANAWLQLYPEDGYTLATLSNVFDLTTPGVRPIVDKAQQLITQ